MLHGQRPIVLMPSFQTQKLFPVLFEHEKGKNTGVYAYRILIKSGTSCNAYERVVSD